LGEAAKFLSRVERKKKKGKKLFVPK